MGRAGVLGILVGRRHHGRGKEHDKGGGAESMMMGATGIHIRSSTTCKKVQDR